jgi:hypothetical protein
VEDGAARGARGLAVVREAVEVPDLVGVAVVGGLRLPASPQEVQGLLLAGHGSGLGDEAALLDDLLVEDRRLQG